MNTLTRADLWSLEEYAQQRAAFRARVLAHKAARRVNLGEHVLLHFEDALTVQYQVQEMLRIERIFEAAGIEAELAAYTPLIPDGSNLKATCLIEYADVEERRIALGRLRGVEDRVWMQVAGYDRVPAVADEDLDRSRDDKTSAVHFLRFEFTSRAIAALRAGASLAAGVDHPLMNVVLDPLPEETRTALLQDFD